MSDPMIELTHAQGNVLLQYCSDKLRWPKELGDEKFDDTQRAIADDLMKRCRNALRMYSPLVKAERINCFGNASNWKKDTDGNSARSGLWSLINQDLPVSIPMSEDAQDGAYHALLLMAHPGSPVPASLGILDDIVWPLARTLRVEKQLRADLKLDQSAKRRSIKRDEVKEEAKA